MLSVGPHVQEPEPRAAGLEVGRCGHGQLRSVYQLLKSRIEWIGGCAFLEIFSGCGKIVGCPRRAHAPAFGIDICSDHRFDLSRRSVVHAIARLISEGFVVGAWLGTPCSTWTLACRLALRTQTEIMGVQ